MNSPANPPLFLLPWAGLANRMRGIDSSLTLCRENDRPLRVIWIREPFCNVKFHDLFFPVACGSVSVRDASPLDDLFYNISKNRNLRIPYLFQMAKFGPAHRLRPQECQKFADRGQVPDIFGKIDRACYVGCGAQLVPANNYGELFRPLPEWDDLASASFGRRVPGRCVGIHVRRGDHDRAIRFSPVHLFLSEVERLLDAQACDSVFVASDDESVKRAFVSRFPDRCWTRSVEHSRGTRHGMTDAFVDMLVLSKCCRVYGSHASTFAETAAWMGRVPYQTLETISSR